MEREYDTQRCNANPDAVSATLQRLIRRLSAGERLAAVQAVAKIIYDRVDGQEERRAA